MKKVFLGLLSGFNWLFYAFIPFILFPLQLLIFLSTFLFDRRLSMVHKFTSFWAWLLVRVNPLWKVKIYGKEKIDPRKAYVMISNHQSLLDILVIFLLFVHFKWVAKIELFRMPIPGWVMSLNQYVKIDRGNKQSAQQMLDHCQRHLQNGSSVMIFPEGTRSEDGNLRKFKEGAFRLAKMADVPILPIVVEGTANALPKNSFIIKNIQHIEVHVLDEIPAKTIKSMTPPFLALYAKDLIEKKLNWLRSPEYNRN